MPNEETLFWCTGKPYIALHVNAGAALKKVSDALGLTDALLCSKIISLLDNVDSTESLLRNKPVLLIGDAASLTDLTLTPSRFLRALDNAGLSDDALTRKLLKLNDNVFLAENVECGVGGAKKTRLFLILGDLAIQLSGD